METIQAELRKSMHYLSMKKRDHAADKIDALQAQVEALTAQLDSYAMALNETKAERDSYKAELLHVARMAEDLKRECSDPESWQAARNTQYMNISYYARAAIAKGTACKGFEIEPGVFSGCNQSAGDCPVCGK